MIAWGLASKTEARRMAGDLDLLASDLASLPLVQVSAAKVEAFLQSKVAEGLSAESVNHLRGYVSRAFSKARKAGRWTGPNPVADVERRKVPRSAPDYLRPEEARAAHDHLPEQRRPFFAVAIYGGLRFGEIAGLRKIDLDLGEHPRLTVARSWTRSMTKGGKARVVPVPAECVPFLRAAVTVSPSDLLFPRADGKMLTRAKRLSPMLRRAMARAGFVTGYLHKCRRRGCRHSESAPDKGLRRCPVDGTALWPVPQVRPVKFKATRATCGSLLIQAGASPAAVSAVLGHADVRITMERYASMAPGFLRSEVERLRLGIRAPAEAANAAAAGAPGPVGATAVPQASEVMKRAGASAGIQSEDPVLVWSGKRDSNPRPSAWEADALPTELFPRSCRQICTEPGPLVKEHRRGAACRARAADLPAPARRAAGD